jgi:hypothetical protein
MARGGKRPGAGRPKGATTHSLVQRLERRAEKSIGGAVQRLKRLRAKIFDGDAHTFLAWVYRNEGLDLEHRIRAAGLALPYERPRLASTSVTVRHVSDMTEEEVAAAIADAEITAAALEGVRSSVPAGPGSQTRH